MPRSCAWLFILSVGVLVSSAGTPARSQQSQTAAPQGVISGQVVDGGTGQPVAGAMVDLMIVGPPLTPAEMESAVRDPSKRRVPMSQQTDERGFFEFSRLPPGPYSGSVRTPGYLIGEVGDSKERPDFSSPVLPIDLGPWEQLRTLRVRIWRPGRISGVAVTESGDPAVKATVQSFRRAYVRGRLTWSAGRAALTDDRGAFQIADLVPGTYTVALLADARLQHAAVFHGGTDNADSASEIRVAAGDRHEGINLTTRLSPSVGVSSLAGSVANYDVAKGRPIIVHLIRRGASSSMAATEALRTTADQAGRFAFGRVPKGDYDLSVWSFPGTHSATPPGGTSYTILSRGPRAPTPAPGEPTWVAHQPLALQEPVRDITVNLQAGARLSGRVIIPGRDTNAAFPPLPVFIRSADGRDLGSSVPARVEPDGSFRSMGLPPGKYFLSIESTFESDTTLRSLTPVSVRFNGQEYAGSAITLGTADIADIGVTMAKPARVSGVVRDAQKRPVPSAHVLVIPVDRNKWNDYPNFMSQFRIHRTLTNRHGLFDTPMLPGSYYVVALLTVPEFWMQQAYFDSVVPSPARVELREGTSVDVAVTIRPSPQR